MKFKVSRDLDAPQALVWTHFMDFARFETGMRRQGATLARVGDWTEATKDVEWRGAVTLGGKSNPLAAKITQLVAPRAYTIDSQIGGMVCHYEISLVSLSETVTRVALVLNLSAKTETARIFLMTLKLTRGLVLQRLEQMLVRQGSAAETEWQHRKGG